MAKRKVKDLNCSNAQRLAIISLNLLELYFNLVLLRNGRMLNQVARIRKGIAYNTENHVRIYAGLLELSLPKAFSLPQSFSSVCTSNVVPKEDEEVIIDVESISFKAVEDTLIQNEWMLCLKGCKKKKQSFNPRFAQDVAHYVCGKRQEYSLSWSHAPAVGRDNGTRQDVYVSDIYLHETYRRTYRSNFYPVGHEDYWRDAPYNLKFYPPNMNNQRGREKGTRFREKRIIEIRILPQDVADVECPCII
ncbi:hypothetical protein M9H77_14206 [Catharanthus roseus]|uniref:Uncharacterized protein n=1 Tax=Catharanthus roseus TaxID=4058 RepID=A0ACC0BMN8_CATRO|nr:hypothetical protein M9H77_14206 [Catharanthus roseus]